VAIESTYGTAVVPTGDQALLCNSITVNPLKQTLLERNNIKGFMGNDPSVVASQQMTVDVELEVSPGGDASGSPAPGIAPRWGALLKACGFQEAVTAAPVTGTAQAGTTTTVTLAAGASAVDDFYSGLSVSLVSETGTALAPAVAGDKTTLKLATAVRDDSYLDETTLEVQHFAGSVLSAGDTLSSTTRVYLPAGNASTTVTLLGLYLEITTGAATERRKITSYDKTTCKCGLDKPLTALPSGASTYKVKEITKVASFVGSTGIVTFSSPLRFASILSTPYKIYTPRLITNYSGSTKVATFTPAVKNKPTATSTYLINANVKYTPVSSAQASVTLYFVLDGVLHSCTGARGTVSFDFSNGALPKAKFSMTGLVARYETGTVASVNFDSIVDPLAVNYANTKNLVVAGYADTVMEKISIDVGNKIVHRNMPGMEQVLITGRSPKGAVTIEAVDPAVFDFLSLMQPTITPSGLLFAHGPVGNQVAFAMPNVELSNPTYSDKDGVAMMGLDAKYLPQGSGNNEIAIICQ
jgi:hypothetical protein